MVFLHRWISLCGRAVRLHALLTPAFWLRGVAEWVGYMMCTKISVSMCSALVQVYSMVEKVDHNVARAMRGWA